MPDRERTRAVYDFIRSYLAAHQGYAPSIREIAGGVYVGHSTVLRHLDRLEAWGLIERVSNRPRSIRVTGRTWPEGEG